MEETYTSDKDIIESVALGAIVAALVAFIINTIGLKRCIILGIIGYIVYKIFW